MFAIRKAISKIYDFFLLVAFVITLVRAAQGWVMAFKDFREARRNRKIRKNEK